MGDFLFSNVTEVQRWFRWELRGQDTYHYITFAPLISPVPGEPGQKLVKINVDNLWINKTKINENKFGKKKKLLYLCILN